VRGLERVVALIARAAGALGGVATVACLVLVGYAVGMRYLAGQPVPWTDKVAGWLVVGLVMLAAPEAQRRFEHIGVDVLLERLPPRLARFAHLIGAASVALVAAVLLDAGLEMVSFSRMVGMMSDLDGVPIWWVQALMPLGAALLLLVATCQVLLFLAGRTPAHLPTPGSALTRDPLASLE
jgi:TRAP-type C4-dicarboxylate transport system permease small subunit